MLSDAILEAIKKIDDLKTKIERYKKDLSESEALVRYSLIDPFLRLIGWDTEDPLQVRPEFSVESGRSDYALLDGTGEIKAFLGAKRLGKPENLLQHISYCLSKGADCFITSDGDKWEVYDLTMKGGIYERKIVEWQLTEEEPSHILRKALVIANFSFFGNSALSPVLTSSFVTNEEKGNIETSYGNKYPAGRKKKEPIRPKAMTIFGKPIEVKYSKDVLSQTAEWLISEGKLKLSDGSLSSGPVRYLINKEPIHINGHPFYLKHKLSNGTFIELHGSHERIEFLSRFLMNQYGYPENAIKVEWSDQ